MAILWWKLHDFVMVDFVLALRVEEREQNFYRKECQKTKKQPGNDIMDPPPHLKWDMVKKNFIKTFCFRFKKLFRFEIYFNNATKFV